MNEAGSWKLIDASRRASKGASIEPERLQAKLERLAPKEIVAFERIFRRLHAAAY